MNKDIYYNKYLKYKNKYLELKKTGGSFRVSPVECDIISGITEKNFNKCLTAHNANSDLNQYFVILFFYSNFDGKISNNLCDILNKILLNTNINTNNIYLFTQNITDKNTKLTTFKYNDKLDNNRYPDNLIFDSGNFSECKQLLQLIKNNNINHFISPTKIKLDINNKLIELIKQLNSNITHNSTVNLSIHTHGFDAIDNDSELISLDGTNGLDLTYSFNELYNLLEPLIVNVNIDILNLISAFCYNSVSFRPRLLEKITLLHISKQINYVTLQVSVPIIDLLFYFADINFSGPSNILLMNTELEIKQHVNKVSLEYPNLKKINYTNDDIQFILLIINNIKLKYMSEYDTMFSSSYKLVDIQPSFYEDVDIVAIVNFYTEYLYNNSKQELSDKIKQAYIVSKLTLLPEYFTSIFDINTYWDTRVKPTIIFKLN